MSPVGFSTTEVLGQHPSPCILVILPLTTLLLNSGSPLQCSTRCLVSSSQLTTPKHLTLSATSASLKLSSLPIASVLLLTPWASHSPAPLCPPLSALNAHRAVCLISKAGCTTHSQLTSMFKPPARPCLSTFQTDSWTGLPRHCGFPR